MAIGKGANSSNVATSGTTCLAPASTGTINVTAGDYVICAVSLIPTSATVTWTKSGGTATIGSFAANIIKTNGNAHLVVSWCKVTGTGTLRIQMASSATITNAVVCIQAYTGSVGPSQNTTGSGSTGTDETLTITTQFPSSWCVLVGTAVSATALSAGVNVAASPVVNTSNVSGTANDLTCSIGSNESALSDGTAEALHFTQANNATYSTVMLEVGLAFIVTPPVLSQTLSTFAPIVQTPRLVTPALKSVSISTFVPTVTVTNNLTVTPSLVSLSLATFGPAISTPRLVTPNIANLTLTGLAPSVVAPRTVTPSITSLSLSTFAPSVDVSSGGIEPGTASLTISTFAPIVRTPRIVTPNLISFTVSGFAPQIRQSIIPPTCNLTLTGYAPEIPTGGEVSLTPSTCVLTLNSFAPIAVSFDPQNIVQISAPRTNTAKSNSQQTTTIIPAGSRIVRV